MAQYLPLPDGSSVEIPEGMSIPEAAARARQKFPEAFAPKEEVKPPESGFTAGFKSGIESLKGDIGALGAGLGFEGGAEYAKQQREKAAQIYETPKFTEHPLDYVAGLLGQSAAYMAAPAAAALGAAALPLTGAAATAAGLGAAGLASATQFTGSNLSRQLEEGTAPEDLKLGYAVASAIPQAALDTVSMKMLPGVGRLLGKWGVEATEEQALAAARKLAEASTAGLIKAGGVQVAKNAGIEGLTEAGQQVLERMQAQLNLMDEGARQEYLDNFVGGATLGGLFGAGSRLGAQSRAKAKVEEADRPAREQAAADAAAQAAQQEQAAFEQQVAGTMQQQTLPGMEQVENIPEAAPAPAPTELLQEQQYLQRVMEDNRMRQSALVEKGDYAGAENLSNQYEAFGTRLKELDAQLKESGFEDADAQRTKLQKQIENTQKRLQSLTGEVYDPIEGRKLLTKLREQQAKLTELGGAQQELNAPLMTLTTPEEGLRQATAATMEQRQADLAASAAPAEEAQPDLFGQQLQDVAQETQAGRAEDMTHLTTLFGDALQGLEPAVKLPDTFKVLPAQQAKANKATFDNLLSQYQKANTALSPAARAQAGAIRDQINSLRSQEDGYLKRAFDARATQDEALANLMGAMTDMRSGIYFGGRDVAAASTNMEGLRKQADEARAKYIESALQEAAIHRRAAGNPAITADEAVKAADEMDKAMRAAIDEIATRSEADRGGAYKEEQVVLPAQMRGSQIVSPAVTQRLDVRPLEERPFGAPAAAQEVIAEQLNVLPQIRDALINKKAPVQKAEAELLNKQFAAAEAAKVAEARGETAGTLGGELRRRTEFVRNKMAKMKAMRPMARDVLNEMADIMDAGKATRAMLDATEPVVDALTSGRQVTQTDLRAIRDTIKAAAPTAVEQQEAGQKDLFGTTTDRRRKDQELGVIRRDFEAFQKSEPVKKARAAIAEAEKAAAQAEKEEKAAAAKRAERTAAELVRLEETLPEQRKAWADAFAEAKKQAIIAARATFNPQIANATKQLDKIRVQVEQTELMGAADITPSKEIMAEVKALREQYGAVKERLENLLIAKESALQDANIRTQALLDSNVEFEKNELQRLEKQYDKLATTAATRPEIQAAQKAAQEQRAAVAVAEKKRADELAERDRLARERDQRMAKAYPGAVLQRVTREVEVQYRDKEGKLRKEMVPMRSNTGYITAPERLAADLREKQMQELETAPKAGTRSESLIPRAIGPVERGVTGKAVTKLTEARGEKVRDVAVTSDEIKEANAIAEELKKASTKERAAQVQEAEKTAAEMMGIDTDKRNWRKKWLEAGGKLDTVLREMDEGKYDAPSFTGLKMGTIKALKAGDIGTVLKNLADAGSSKFVQKLASALTPLVGDVKVVISEDPIIVDGRRAAADYNAKTQTARFDVAQLSEENVLHELIHAATLSALRRPMSALNAAQQAARRELEAMFKYVKNNKALAREYGRENVEEFASELLSNKVMQDKLKDVKWYGGGNMFTRFINRVLGMLGLKEGVDFRAGAVDKVLNLFEKAAPIEEANTVASILRGVFPGKEAIYTDKVSTSAQDAAKAMVAGTRKLGDKVEASFFNPTAGLAWRTQLLDRFAPVEALLKKGVERGLIPNMQLFQTLYYMRFGEQRSQYVAQAASVGVPQRIKQADGTYTIEAVKGVNIADIAKTLGNSGIGSEQAAEEMFTGWLAGLRAGQGKIGWNKLNFKDAAAAKANWEKINQEVQSNPQIKEAFNKARDQYREYNANLLNFLADSGAMSREKAAELKAMDYVPFYRLDGDALNLMIDNEHPIQIGNIAQQPYLKELVGGEDAILPFFSSALQNTNLLMDMALRNIQTKDVAYVLKQLDGAEIRNGSGPAGNNIIRFREHGEMKHAVIDTDAYGVPAELLVKGMEGIKTTIPAVVRLMRYPANLLRKTVTMFPTYALRQAVRDPLNAWLVTGGDFTPIASSFKELGKMVAGKSQLEETLQNAGAISSNVFSGDKQDMEMILRSLAGGKGGWQKLIAKAEGLAIQGDSSTRAVLYDMYRKKGMTHMQALLGSLESMNFSRRGVSPSLQFMSMMVPFFNAQIQGLDVLWRAARGQSLLEKEMDVKATMLKRGALMAAGTIAYAALMQDDDSYKNATPEQRALNWLIPVPGTEATLRVPIPFELGYAFKAIPEMIYNVALGDQKASEAAKALGALAYQSVPIGMPQGIKPLVEVATNYSFFTGDQIETARMQRLEKGERYTANTSEVAKMLSAAVGHAISPVQVEYLIRGYTGTMGATMTQLPDIALRPLSGEAERPTKLINEYPVIGSLFQPADGRGVVNAAFNRIEEFQQAHNTLQAMIQEGRTADAKAFAQRFSTEIAATSIGGMFRQQMGELAKLRRAVTASQTLTPDQKRDRIDEIKKLEIALSRRIKDIGS